MIKQLSLPLTLMFNLFIMNSTMAQEQEDGRITVYMWDIKETRENVDLYTSPKERTFMVSIAQEPILIRALSKKAREEWYKTTTLSAGQKKEVNAALDDLASAAYKKLPNFIPGPEKFAFGTEAEKKMITAGINDLNTIDIFKIGLEDKDWRYDEKDAYGNPTGRRKWGYFWYKKKPGNADYTCCRVYEVYLYQPYAGGGAYGDTKVYYERIWMSGCPK